MSDNNHQITVGDARAALASIEAANNITVNNMRPPLWLVLLCSVALGVKTTAMGFMLNDSLWSGIQWGSYLVCCFSVILWIVALRVNGVTIKITDVNITKKGLVAALLICALLILSRVIYLATGSILFSVVAGILSALILALNLHFGQLFNAKNRD